MSPWAALYLFPLQAADAARAVRGRIFPGLFVLTPPLLAAGYLLVMACGVADALAMGATIAVVLACIAAGALCFSIPASIVAARPFPMFSSVGLYLLWAGWAGVLYPLLVAVLGLAGVGALGPLAAAFALLIWGVATAMGVIGGGEAEGGRSLVAACIILTGALAGLVSGILVAGTLTLPGVHPAPAAAVDFGPGTPLLIQPGEPVEEGALYLARDPGTGAIVFARCRSGRLEPLEGISEALDPTPLGRVFFHFDGLGGVPGSGQRRNP